MTLSSTFRRQLQADGIAIELVQLDHCAFDEVLQGVADHVAGEGEGVEGFLIEEVGAFAVAVEVGSLDHLEVGLFEAVAGLEGFVKDGAGEQVAHLEADEGLAAAGGGGGDLGFKTVEGGVFKLKVHLAFDGDCFNQGGHGFLKNRVL